MEVPQGDDRPWAAEDMFARVRSRLDDGSRSTRELIDEALNEIGQPLMDLSAELESATATGGRPVKSEQSENPLPNVSEVPQTVTGGPMPEPASTSSSKRALPTEPPIDVPNHELIRCLGAGGFGQVWLAKHTLTAHYRACKLISESRPVELDGLKHLKQCVPAHPNLFPIEEVGEEDGWLYCLMPLADNASSRGAVLDSSGYEAHTLSLHLQRRGRLPSEELRNIVAELAQGLGHLHEQGITHGDVKPENMLRHGDHWTVADYGLLRDLSDPVCGGTRGYVPPEGPGGRAADQYALGVVMMQVLTGRSPGQLGEFRSKPVAQLNLDRSAADLRVIILRATEPRPEDRFGAMREMVEALKQPSGGMRSRGIYLAGVGLALVATLIIVGVQREAGESPGDAAAPQRFFTTEPVRAAPAATEVKIKSFEIQHSHFNGESEVSLGAIGRDSFRTSFDDSVTVHAEFSAAAHAFLIALDTDGDVRLLYPCAEDDELTPLENEPPRALQSLVYPPNPQLVYALNDGAGVQAFVLVTSADPLPPYAQWAEEHGAPSWPGEQTDAVVWRSNGRILEPVDGTRGEVRPRHGYPPHINGAFEWVRQLKDIDDVRFTSFPVEPRQ